VLIWSNYLAERTVPRFEEQFGVHVRTAIYESNEEMLARVQSGNSGWDVVVPTNYLIGPMRQMGLLARLDRRRLPNLDQVAPEFARPQWDPEIEWAAPFMWGSSGIAVRRDVAEKPSSWADLWDGRWRGRITMLDDPLEVFAAALAKLGLPLCSRDPRHLLAARQEAMRQKPLLRAYINAEVRDQIVAGDILAAQLWATVTAQADAEYVYPAEGFLLYMDTVAILRESSRTELAHEFVNYLIGQEASSEIARETLTATANAAAAALLPDSIRRNPALFPPPHILARGTWSETLDAPGQRLLDRCWTEVKVA
jgi:spermidine/putrescine-binding protein